MTYWRLTDPDWDESKHPRKRDGKFAPKGRGEAGGAKPKAKPPKGFESHEVIQHASWTRGRLPTVTHHEGKLWAHTPEGVRPATPEDLMPAIRAKASNPEHRLHALVHGGGQPPEPERKPEPEWRIERLPTAEDRNQPSDPLYRHRAAIRAVYTRFDVAAAEQLHRELSPDEELRVALWLGRLSDSPGSWLEAAHVTEEMVRTCPVTLIAALAKTGLLGRGTRSQAALDRAASDPRAAIAILGALQAPMRNDLHMVAARTAAPLLRAMAAQAPAVLGAFVGKSHLAEAYAEALGGDPLPAETERAAGINACARYYKAGLKHAKARIEAAARDDAARGDMRQVDAWGPYYQNAYAEAYWRAVEYDPERVAALPDEVQLMLGVAEHVRRPEFEQAAGEARGRLEELCTAAAQRVAAADAKAGRLRLGAIRPTPAGRTYYMAMVERTLQRLGIQPTAELRRDLEAIRLGKAAEASGEGLREAGRRIVESAQPIRSAEQVMREFPLPKRRRKRPLEPLIEAVRRMPEAAYRALAASPVEYEAVHGRANVRDGRYVHLDANNREDVVLHELGHVWEWALGQRVSIGPTLSETVRMSPRGKPLTIDNLELRAGPWADYSGKMYNSISTEFLSMGLPALCGVEGFAMCRATAVLVAPLAHMENRTIGGGPVRGARHASA